MELILVNLTANTKYAGAVGSQTRGVYLEVVFDVASRHNTIDFIEIASQGNTRFW